MLDVLAVALGRTLRILLRLVRPGGGSALPGVLVSNISPQLLSRALAKLPQGLVVVSGSAGKSSTTQLLVRILSEHGLRVFSNPSTANIKQGYFAAVLTQSNWLGRLNADIAVIEVDEGHGATLVDELVPRMAILTNVLSDQLDRFVDPEYVIQKLTKIGRSADVVLINADDPNLNQINFDREVLAVGLGAGFEPEERPAYALNFEPAVELSKQATVDKGEGLAINLGETSFATSSSSAPHALNDALATLAASHILDLDVAVTSKILADSKRVFARNEIVELGGREVNLRLVQNPTSFQLNLDELAGSESPLMLMAGSDIHDPSWLWTVDFSTLKSVDVVGGVNAYDLALRLRYDGVLVGQVIPDSTVAADAFAKLEGPKPTILFSADAMRRVRRHWGLAK